MGDSTYNSHNLNSSLHSPSMQTTFPPQSRPQPRPQPPPQAAMVNGDEDDSKNEFFQKPVVRVRFTPNNVFSIGFPRSQEKNFTHHPKMLTPPTSGMFFPTWTKILINNTSFHHWASFFPKTRHSRTMNKILVSQQEVLAKLTIGIDHFAATVLGSASWTAEQKDVVRLFCQTQRSRLAFAAHEIKKERDKRISEVRGLLPCNNNEQEPIVSSENLAERVKATEATHVAEQIS